MSTPAAPLPPVHTLAPPVRLHPELDCGTGEWDKLLYGNHRIVVEVPEPAAGVEGRPRANSVVLPWRRQDANPAAVDVIVVSAVTGRRVLNVVSGARTAAAGQFTFEPVDGAGTYHFYYLPYFMGGPAHYPQAQYLPARPTADPDWVRAVAGSLFPAGQKLPGAGHPEAVAVRYEAASDWDSLAPMNFTATAAEMDALHDAHSGSPFLLFAQDRLHPVSMKTAIPAHWALEGPVAAALAGDFSQTLRAQTLRAQTLRAQTLRAQTLRAGAQPGEDYVVQLGLYALQDVEGLSVDVRAPACAGKARCLNTSGVDRLGRPFTKVLAVRKGDVQALYVVIPVPAETAGSRFRTTITVSGSPGAGAVEVELVVSATADPELAAGGHGDPRQLRRLAWLDSTLAQDDELVRPFTPVVLDEETLVLGILGRSMKLAPNGLPAQLSSTFTGAVTGVDGPERTLLARTFSLAPRTGAGPLTWDHSPLQFTVHGPARIGWTCTWTSCATALKIIVEGQLEADGAADFAVRLSLPDGAMPVDLEDVRLSVEFDADAVPLSMGLGSPGGDRVRVLDWSWDVDARNQDSIWLGDTNIGVQLALRDDNYERPLNTNFYREKPLNAPGSWSNPQSAGAAGATLRQIEASSDGHGGVVFEAFSGARTLKPGDSLNYGFRLLLTPFKPINPQRQLANRYFHEQGSVAEIAATGASVINVHHATSLAPFINDPLLSADVLAAYVQQAHAAGLKVKVYDTVRELSAHSPDVLPMLSLVGEIFVQGPGKGHIWLQEHVRDNYVSAWYAPNVDDIALVTTGESRLQNWYIRGLDELVHRSGLDGIYLDDIAFDREAMKRVRKVLQRRCADPEIDLHSANQFNEGDGFASSANMYMEQLPYTDRLWLGEYFDYEGTDRAYWLVEISGIPFGLMGEMLEGGGNPWRGLVFGMTGRAPMVDTRALWQFWAEHSLADAPMEGHWDPGAPVRTSHPEVLATTWTTADALVVAIASWAPETVSVRLEFAPEFERFSGVCAAAPSIQGFQSAAAYGPGAPVTVAPGKGAVLVLRQPPPAVP